MKDMKNKMATKKDKDMTKKAGYMKGGTVKGKEKMMAKTMPKKKGMN